MTLSYEQGLRLAKLMKLYDSEIKKRVVECKAARHGVVALHVASDYRSMHVQVLDEPYDSSVRVTIREKSDG